MLACCRRLRAGTSMPRNSQKWLKESTILPEPSTFEKASQEKTTKCRPDVLKKKNLAQPKAVRSNVKILTTCWTSIMNFEAGTREPVDRRKRNSRNWASKT